MALTAWAAGWFFLTTLPFCLFVAYSDLSRMKIPNLATDGLLMLYVLVGLIALPFSQYLWGFAHFAVMLVVGMVLNAGRVLGAGDAKFVASAAPFVPLADLTIVFIVLASALVGGFATHRLVKHTRLRRIAPDWESWSTGARFPMGFPLAMALSIYFLLVWVIR